jgi:AraC-like DNA-binding protein
MLSERNDILYSVNIESILVILLFIGGAQGLLLSAALVSVRRGNRTANRILAVLLFFFSIMILFHAIGHFHARPQASEKHQWLIHALVFIVAPLLFLYSKALTKSDFKLHLSDSLHFFPSFAALMAVFLLGDILHSGDFSAFIGKVILAFLTLQMLTYLIRMHFILRNHTKIIQNTYSSLEKINLRWLRFFVVSQAVIWPIAFFIDISRHGTSEMGFVWLLVSVFMYITGYFGIRQPEIFSGELQAEQLPTQIGKKKYERSALSPEQAEAILQRLQTFMQSSKPYVIPTLTLPALSKQMNVSPHHLSQIINERLNKNFFEFINHFRVKEAKRLLKDPENQHLTLAAIGFEAGFNSVSSFNSIFKKATSLTPSQYRSSDNLASENL